LTIREDEFLADLKAFPDDPGIYKGRHREYALRSADAGQGVTKVARFVCSAASSSSVASASASSS
jgi:hypothetical protein